jgi:DNA-binding transcriptional ArsR family regulator
MSAPVAPEVLDQRPDRLAETADPADVLAALQKHKQISAQQQQALDYAISHWVTQALSRAADTESLLLLDRLCALFIRRTAHAQGRVEGWRTLLENKRLAVQGRQARGTRQLLQTQPVRQALARGEMSQTELAAAVGVSSGRISQLLNVMEEAGLVQRRRVGRENLVSLPSQPAPALGVPVVEAPATKLRGALAFLSDRRRSPRALTRA